MSDPLEGAGRVLVLGAARSGLAAAAALRRLRPRLVVRLVDREPREGESEPGVEVVAGDRDERLAADVDLVIKSPGIPGEAPLVQAARRRRVPVWSEVELGYRLLGEGHPIVGVTGTNGKTTTTSLCAAMLEGGGVPALAAGNIGLPLSGLAGTLAPGTSVVCELSSFQLEDVERFHARVGVLLNLTPDHLDRHGTLDAYGAVKLRLFERQQPDDAAVLCDDDPWLARLPDAALPGAGRRLRVRAAAADADALEAFAGSHLVGSHNLENALCALAAAEQAGASRAGALAALRAFQPPPHRLEDVGSAGGVRYVNDSKATNPEATMRALGAFSGGVHLILGGSLKGASFAVLASVLRAAVAERRVRAVYLAGEAAEAIARDLDAAGVAYRSFPHLADAVHAARAAAAPGDTVLLSPACASFDEFRDFEHRGDSFRALVAELAS
jgi:UDP-N-acetylmuramoylalanine--D-glutamate ligase